MPIPTGGAWPPAHMAPAYQSYRDWDAWYSGDVAKLRAVYLGRSVDGSSLPPSQRIRPGQVSGGIVGTLSRWLWGTPATAGQRDGRLHCPLAPDLARTAANLIFSEPPKLSSKNAAAQGKLEEMQANGLSRFLLHAADVNSALGDVYIRPIIDEEVLPGRAFPALVHADGAIPTIRFEKLIEVTFWSTVARDGDVHWRLLEHHDVVDQAGRITYRLHKGSPDHLGDRVPFTELDVTAEYAKEPYQDGSIFTGINRLDVVRVPNSGPQRVWRTEPGLKYLGLSDFQGNEQWFDRLDTAWTSWMTDLHLAKARLLVPEWMLQSLGAGQGAGFNADREIFTGLTTLAKAGDKDSITAVQFQIRVAEHKATTDALVETALRHAGLSSQTLGEEGDIAVTATEIQARERQSFATRGARIQTWDPAIAEYVEIEMAIEQARFRGRPDPVRPDVEFADSVTESPETTARTIQLLDAANAMSTLIKVRTLHPEWTNTEVLEEVARINGDQQATTVQDPGTFTGGNPRPTPPEPDDDVDQDDAEVAGGDQ